MLVLVLSCAWPSAANAASSLSVTGFIVGGDPTSLIDSSASGLRTVGADGVELTPTGRAFTRVDRSLKAELARSHADGLQAELLISNYSERIQDFSEPLGHRLLSSRAHIRRVAQALARIVRSQRWDGICVDLESLTRRDATGLTRFLRALRNDLPRDRTLSMALMNATSPAGFTGWGYQLKAIGSVTSRVILMAYDEHGPWEQTPGPIGELSWQRAGLGVLLESVPASKVDLGVAGYGYGWRPHRVLTLGGAQARKLAAADGTTPTFDDAAGEWTATLHDGSVLWWSDLRSYLLRVALAQSYGLHGLAVWSLGLSDPLPAT